MSYRQQCSAPFRQGTQFKCSACQSEQVIVECNNTGEGNGGKEALRED